MVDTLIQVTSSLERSVVSRVVVATILAVALAACRGGESTRRDEPARPADTRAESAARLPSGPPERPRTATAPARSFGESVGFHSRRQLEEHFHKHGAEFGASSPHEYLLEAQRLRDAPVGGPILELDRDDGVITKFDRGTGAFIAFDDDGTIRTFFKPNVGEDYFRRQARRREDRR